MFSGIRYILGYTDDTGDSAAQSTDELPVARSSESSSATPAAVLEQKLNAVTTKFTEQLLPQQASIEQLQSSSHQLLPSIKEQHEENESRKQHALDQDIETVNLDTTIDDDSFEADSWELLDLVDKVEVESADQLSVNSSVQKDEASQLGICKSTSGILKSNSALASDNGNQQSRQKPKVSFETPDLVKSKQEIEEAEPKGAQSSSKKGKNNKNKRNSKATSGAGCKKEAKANDVRTRDEAPKEKKLNKLSKTNEKSREVNHPSLIVDTKRTEFKPLELSVVMPVKAPPTLNYAKALSAKLKSDVAKKAVEVVPKVVDQTIPRKEEANRPMKRNRPTSTSSWSSSDEVETVKNDWGLWIEPGKGPRVNAEDDDKESLASSGFSDCDYGYGGINDYVMRPKKLNSKRNRTQSGSSGSFRAPKLGCTSSKKHAGGVVADVVATKSDEPKCLSIKSTQAKASCSDGGASVAGKNSKPKKKLILTATNKVSSMDFLKPEAVEKSRKDILIGSVGPLSMKKHQQTPAGSSNDSSDIAEMDESWYVTPPPCFTGANKMILVGECEQQPLAKEADRENALIEHPSIYIAGTSRGSKVDKSISDDLGSRRQPIQVRPIEPERRPGWQLKRQRPKRRPLTNSVTVNKQQVSGGNKAPRCPAAKNNNDSSSSSGSSSSSTPTFMVRIGSSIVANLTNLTNGLVASGALNSCSPVVGHSSPLVEGSEKMQQAVTSRSNLQNVCNVENRKQMSKSSMKRQNICAQQANRQRRPDRRLKMFATPNGCSINRKVHASIH